MINFTSDELKVITKALDFYKYEMSKTDDMTEYNAWMSANMKFNKHLEFHRGVWKWKELEE